MRTKQLKYLRATNDRSAAEICPSRTRVGNGGSHEVSTWCVRFVSRVVSPSGLMAETIT